MFDYVRGKVSKINTQEAFNEFEKISQERKESIRLGHSPESMTTQGYILFKEKYVYGDATVNETYERIANTLAEFYHIDVELAKAKFTSLLKRNVLQPSTPVMSNTGTDRGDSVSCSGNDIQDTVFDFYDALKENAVLSQRGYGTSSYLGGIRPRGAKISKGGKAQGTVPVYEDEMIMATKISQGYNRRGAWAGYLEENHEDFHELSNFVILNSSDANVGWIYDQESINNLHAYDLPTIKRFNRVAYIRSRFGKGYILKRSTANKYTTKAIKNSGCPIKASNLCIEIMLPSNDKYTFSCVLSSLNLSKWYEFEEDDIFWSLIFLDCIVSKTLKDTANVRGMEKIHAFTRDFRAVGLGALGWHTLLQENSIPFESLKAKMLNKKIFATIRKETVRASQHLAKVFGEPLHCKGTGMANATTMAIAPNVASAILAGSVSQSIEPQVSNAYNQNTAAGELSRFNPTLAKILKAKGVYSAELAHEISTTYLGSVQHLDCLTEHEKRVFKTAKEISQDSILEQAEDRQEFVDQGQSLNLFPDGDEIEVGRILKKFMEYERLKSAYYQRSQRSVRGSNGECLACHA